jgi:hypothetical protein
MLNKWKGSMTYINVDSDWLLDLFALIKTMRDNICLEQFLWQLLISTTVYWSSSGDN